MIERAMLVWLVNALWLIPLVGLAAALAARFGRLGPRGRHGVWMAALVLAVTSPALPAAVSPPRAAPVRPTPPGPTPAVSAIVPAILAAPAPEPGAASATAPSPSLMPRVALPRLA